MPAITEPKELLVLRAAYEAGHLTNDHICKEWGISKRTLHKYANKDGWLKPARTVEVREFGAARLNSLMALSQVNKNKLEKAGGGELYAATEKYFQTAYEIQEASHQTLIDRKALVEETRVGARSIDDGAEFEEVVRFYHIQASKMSLITEAQKVTESVAKAAAVTMKGLRESLGLDKDVGTKDGGGNIAVFIVNALKEGQARLDELPEKELKNITATVEPV